MPRFATGDRVRILDLRKTGHMRVPDYVRGAIGAIERHCGTYANPEELAYGVPDPARVDLYRVRIAQAALWAGAPPSDELEIEIYDHWLEPVA